MALSGNKRRPVNERASDHIVMQLMSPYLNKRKNKTTDQNYFTSLRLASQLKEKQTICLETVNKFRREVPLSLKKVRELYFCKLYKSGHITLTAYQEKVKNMGCYLANAQGHYSS